MAVGAHDDAILQRMSASATSSLDVMAITTGKIPGAKHATIAICSFKGLHPSSPVGIDRFLFQRVGATLIPRRHRLMNESESGCTCGQLLRSLGVVAMASMYVSSSSTPAVLFRNLLATPARTKNNSRTNAGNVFAGIHTVSVYRLCMTSKVGWLKK